MHFFLQGERGVGKSYLIQEMIEKSNLKTAGFCIQRLYKEGRVVGFRALNRKQLGFVEPDFELDVLHRSQREDGTVDSSMIQECRLGKDGIFLFEGKREIRVLEELILQVEKDCQEKAIQLVFLDEIGGCELKSKVFMGALYRILDMGKPCIGVFKSEENFMHMIQQQKLEKDFLIDHRKLCEKLLKKGCLATMTNDTKQFCAGQIAAFLTSIKKNIKETSDGWKDEIQSLKIKNWHPVIKVQIANETPFIGPGCVQLLSLIEKSNSVRLACEEMKLSYSKAWKILNNLEEQTGKRLLIRCHGGKNGGETFLTEEGKVLLKQFQQFDQECKKTVDQIFKKYFEIGL